MIAPAYFLVWLVRPPARPPTCPAGPVCSQGPGEGEHDFPQAWSSHYLHRTKLATTRDWPGPPIEM